MIPAAAQTLTAAAAEAHRPAFVASGRGAAVLIAAAVAAQTMNTDPGLDRTATAAATAAAAVRAGAGAAVSLISAQAQVCAAAALAHQLHLASSSHSSGDQGSRWQGSVRRPRSKLSVSTLARPPPRLPLLWHYAQPHRKLSAAASRARLLRRPVHLRSWPLRRRPCLLLQVVRPCRLQSGGYRLCQVLPLQPRQQRTLCSHHTCSLAG